MNAIVKFAPSTFTPFVLPEESKAWLAIWLPKTRYCHYFALSTFDQVLPMGDWNAPFFDIDDLNEFARTIKYQNPDIEFGVIEGNLHVNCLDNEPINPYWAKWQQDHRGRLAYIEELRRKNTEELQARKEKMLKRLKCDITCEFHSHYFYVFQEGKEVYPYGIDQIPYFTFDEAEEARQRYQLYNPDNFYYISMGAISNSYMFRADGKVDTAEQYWIDQHKQRLEFLLNHGDFTHQTRLFRTAEAKKSYQEWLKAALTNVDKFHYFIVESESTNEGQVDIRSPFFFSIIDAIAYTAKIEMDTPNRDFKIKWGQKPIAELMQSDGYAIESYQKFIDQHKARLQSLAVQESA